jgi:hypothetical protein
MKDECPASERDLKDDRVARKRRQRARIKIEVKMDGIEARFAADSTMKG